MTTTAPRSRARVLLTLAAAGSTALGLGGCVSQEKYDDLFEANRTLRSRNADLQSRLNASGSSLDTLRSQTDGADDLREANLLLRQQLEASDRQIQALEGRLDGLELVALPADLDASLSRLAQENPDLLTYDAERGMIRFASDLTFGLGSAELTDTARNTLRSLASALNTSSANSFTVRVVGHTDSIGISARIRDSFPTNMHLSVARAIAVRAELARLGVNANRMQAAGWGPHRPLVENNANGITPQNRRVEVYLLGPGRDADRGVAPGGSAGGSNGGSAGGSAGGSTGGSVRPDPDGPTGGVIPTK